MKNPVFDKDLTPLLRQCDNTDLQAIIDVILADTRQTLDRQAAYLEHQGDHRSYVDEIVYEVTSFGGNSLTNLVRGHGITYAEMVHEVVGLLGIHAPVGADVARLEQLVVLKLLKLGREDMDEADTTALAELLELSAGIDNADAGASVDQEELSRRLATEATSLSGDRIRSAVESAKRAVQRRGAATAVLRAALVKLGTSGLGGPASWTATALQTVYELFGPNHATTVTLVATIGLIRQKQLQIERDNLIPEVE